MRQVPGIEDQEGMAALTQISDSTLDLILLNLSMPGMSGLEVLEHLHSRDPTVPVILLTAHPSS